MISNTLAMSVLFKAGIVTLGTVARVLGLANAVRFDLEMILSELRGKTPEEITDIATRAGLVVFFPRPGELMLDIDEPFAAACVRLGARINSGAVQSCLNKANIRFGRSLFITSRGGNLHAYIQMNIDISDYERIVIQAALRSDPVRDILSMLRLRDGNQGDYHMALFETEEQAELVRKWRMENTVTAADIKEYESVSL